MRNSMAEKAAPWWTLQIAGAGALVDAGVAVSNNSLQADTSNMTGCPSR
jgi:hypothetical protein